jgi:hypothetical protein
MANMKRINLKWLQRKNRSKFLPFTDEEIRAKAHEIRLSRNGNAGLAHQDWKEEIQDLKAAIEALETENSIRKRLRKHSEQFDAWTGLKDKTLWDIYVFLLPIFIGLSTIIFQQEAKKSDLFIAEDRARQETLSKYLDQMSELLINKGLRKSESDSEVFILAQARTTTALRSLDSQRQTLLIEFLRSSDLLAPKKRVGLLQNSYLSDTNLSSTFLQDANLSKTYLTRVNLSKTDLKNTDLSDTSLKVANLSNANLENANLSSANLAWANLKDAENLTQKQLEQAKLCRTTLPNGEISDRDCKALGIDPKK